MIYSQYNVSASIDQTTDFIINLRTQAAVQMSKVQHKELQKSGGLALSANARKSLVDMGLLATDTGQEQRAAIEALTLRADNPDHLSFVVMTTMRCNFGCSYCYQERTLATLNDLRSDAVVAAFKARLDQQGPRTVDVGFFGGEPLIYPARVADLGRRLRTATLNSGAEFECSVVTNGYFVTDQILDDLDEIRCTRVMVTLDGPAEIHDQRRPLTSGRGTFAKIAQNLKRLAERQFIILNVVLDRDNAHAFADLVAQFPEMGLTRDTCRVNLSCTEASLFTDLSVSSALNDHPRIMAQAMRVLLEAGLTVPIQLERQNGAVCHFQDRSFFSVDPEGKVFGCDTFVGVDDRQIGNVLDGRLPDKPPLDLDPECAACRYLPSCAGGCSYKRHMHAVGSDGLPPPGPDCILKPYFQRFFDHVLPVYHEASHHKAG